MTEGFCSCPSRFEAARDCGIAAHREKATLALDSIKARSRVVSPHAIFKVRTCAARRRCSSHMAERHYIEVGEQIVWAAVPPESGDYGNPSWLHAAYCLDCAPSAALPEPSDSSSTGSQS